MSFQKVESFSCGWACLFSKADINELSLVSRTKSRLQREPLPCNAKLIPLIGYGWCVKGGKPSPLSLLERGVGCGWLPLTANGTSVASRPQISGRGNSDFSMDRVFVDREHDECPLRIRAYLRINSPSSSLPEREGGLNPHLTPVLRVELRDRLGYWLYRLDHYVHRALAPRDCSRCEQ